MPIYFVAYISISVIIPCLNSPTDRRTFMLLARQLQMTTDEYVYLMPNTFSVGKFMQLIKITANKSIRVFLGQTPMWMSRVLPYDGLNEQAREAFQNVLLVLR